MGLAVDPRYVFSALAGLLAVVILFAVITTVRHISRPAPQTTARTVVSR
jgi:hypothetical protein